MTAKQLREERAKTAVEIRQLADKANNEKRDFTAEEKPHWEAVNKKYDEQTRQIEIAERAEKVDAEQRGKDDGDKGRKPGRDDVDTRKQLEDLNRRDDQDEDDEELTDDDLGIDTRKVHPQAFGLALQGWLMRHSEDGLEPERRHFKAAKQAGININARAQNVKLMSTRDQRAFAQSVARAAREGRSLSAVDLAAGASTIAPSFVNSLEQNLYLFGGVLQVAEIIRTDGGNEMTWPTVDDTANEGEIIGENEETDDDEEPTTGAVTWGAKKFSSKMIKVPVELLEDSAFDFASIVGGMAGERIGRRFNRYATTGPKGLITKATVGVTTASATAVTSDELFDLIHSVTMAYRGPGCGFMFADQFLLAIRKMKDGNNNYIWRAGLSDGEPDRILNYPYAINEHMDATLTATKTVAAFGQLNKYKVRQVRGLRLVRLNERFAEKDQVAFLALMRADGNLLDAGGHPIKTLKMHA